MAKKDLDDVPFAVASGNRTALIVLGVVCFVLLLSNIAFATIAAVQYKKKEKTPEPIIFEVEKAEHKIVRIERGDLGASKESLLRSVALREYVEWRETINHLDEKQRWRKVKLMSSPSLFKDFYNVMNPEVNKDSVLTNTKYTRKIEIITDYSISTGNRNIHRVEFYATDTLDGESFPTQRYVAIIQYESGDSLVSYKDRFINIDGLRIVRYEINGA